MCGVVVFDFSFVSCKFFIDSKPTSRGAAKQIIVKVFLSVALVVFLLQVHMLSVIQVAVY